MRFRVLLLLALVAVACAGRETPDDQALHQDIVSAANGAEVTFDATVMNDPVDSGGTSDSRSRSRLAKRSRSTTTPLSRRWSQPMPATTW